MGKTINFIYDNTFYDKILDGFIDPIIEHIPDGRWNKSRKFQENMLNVGFFTDTKTNALKDVFMSHGIADKNWRGAQRVSSFDYVFVSGDAWKSKLIKQGLDASKIFVVGYSKLDNLFNNFNKVSSDKIHLLYAPTHNTRAKKYPNESCLSSYPRMNIHISNPPSDIEVRYSLHPANVPDIQPTYNEYEWADVVISDCSSTLYEAWALGIPVVFPDWLVRENILNGFPKSFEHQIYSEQIGYHVQNQANLWQTIRLAYANGMDNKAIEFIEGILPKRLRGTSGKAMADTLLELSERT